MKRKHLPLLLVLFCLIMTWSAVPASAASKSVTVSLAATKKTTKKTITVGDKLTVKSKNGSKVVKAASLSYTTSNKKVATVSKKGVITAKKAGTATITITTSNKKKKAAVKVTVKKKAAAPTLQSQVKITTESCENGVVILATNTSKQAVEVTPTVRFFDTAGSLIKEERDLYGLQCVEPGETSVAAAYFHDPYASYEVSYTVAESPWSTVGVKNFRYTSRIRVGHVVATFTNQASKSSDVQDFLFVPVYCLFYDAKGQLADFDFGYAQCLTYGSTYDVEFSNYAYTGAATYKIYPSGAYYMNI